jgi:hypothetical protein
MIMLSDVNPFDAPEAKPYSILLFFFLLFLLIDFASFPLPSQLQERLGNSGHDESRERLRAK